MIYFKSMVIQVLSIILILLTSITCFAEPFLTPNDPFIRHEIRFLGDEERLDALQNTWPLNLGGIDAMRTDSNFEISSNLLDKRLSNESNSGWSPIITKIGFSDDRVTAVDLVQKQDQVLLPMRQFPG